MGREKIVLVQEKFSFWSHRGEKREWVGRENVFLVQEKFGCRSQHCLGVGGQGPAKVKLVFEEG